MKLIIIAIATLFISGCATKIHTYDKDGTPTKGIPVPKPQLVKIVTTTKYTKKPDIKGYTGICDVPLVTESYDYFATGDVYYINFDPSEFAEGDFEINYNDKGMVTKISLNSKANTGLDSVNSLLGTLLPYASATKAEELATKGENSLLGNNDEIKQATRKSQCVEKSKTTKVFPLNIGKPVK